MNKHGGRPSEELKHFTNREKEQDVFRRHIGAAEGTALPVVMFYGVGGVGKTWLTKKLRGLVDPAGQEAHPLVPANEKAIPSARLDLDTSTGGVNYSGDPASAYAQMSAATGRGVSRL